MQDKRIRIFMLRVSPEGVACQGYLAEIDSSLESMQEIVGGYIQAVTLNDNILVIMNDEGKINGLPPNRAWVSKRGEVLDILCGNTFCCRSAGEDFGSIEEEDISVILEILKPCILTDNLVLVPEEICPKYEEVMNEDSNE